MSATVRFDGHDRLNDLPHLSQSWLDECPWCLGWRWLLWTERDWADWEWERDGQWDWELNEEWVGLWQSCDKDQHEL